MVVNGSGGGMLNAGGLVTVTNGLFAGNSANYGGGMFNSGNILTVANCTFSGNAANINGGGISGQSSYDTVSNCILWDNSPNEIYYTSGTLNVTYTDIEGGWPGTGNINTNPLFVDPLNDDYRLSPGSPCIDAGHNGVVPSDSADLDDDGDITELTPLDLDGNPRFVDDPDTPDTGNPGAPHTSNSGAPGPIVDMGAYEFQVPCPNDINGDGTIDMIDLVDLLLCFGQPAIPGCVGEDINEDGNVNVLDLIDLLLAFGTACP